MRIFGRKTEENREELMVRPMEQKHRFDLPAALAKAVLIFLIIYGVTGGFLSAYEIDYNKTLCPVAIFLFAMALCVVYESGLRWLKNSFSLLFFALFFGFAMSNYWTINSGYYAILNHVLEWARDYLHIRYGTEYDLMVKNEYAAVTTFVLFIGMVCSILLNIHIQNRVSLVKVVLFTFFPFVLPLYFERSPRPVYIGMLLVAYGTILLLGGMRIKTHLSGQIRTILPRVALFVAVSMLLVALLLPQDSYEAHIPKNPYKVASEGVAGRFTQYGMMAFLPGSAVGAGVSGGMLSQGSAVMPNYETDLIVRYTPYHYVPVYLKAFTGKDYEGTRWTAAEGEMPGDGLMTGTMEARKEIFESDPGTQGKGRMEVENVAASGAYDYRPYYTDGGTVTKDGNRAVYTYYPAVGEGHVPHQEVDEAYLTVPDSCLRAVRSVCEDAGFSGSPEEVAEQVIAYFDENYSYTLRPGYNFGNKDYISYFLLDSKRGYCAHFASAATMLFRNLGIPARYVEGYAFSYEDLVVFGKLVEGAEYGDYYSGYSPIGETGLVEVKVSDAQAHGWVEIYVEGKGWIVVDPTPASEEEETSSFWDDFMQNFDREGDENGLNFDTDTLGTYLERTFRGIGWLILAAGLFAVLMAVGGHLLRIRREKKLPMREQIRLEYARLKKRLNRKHPEFRTCRTVREQLNFVRYRYGAEISEEQEKELYQAFFGADTDEGYAETLTFLKKLRRGRE